MLCFVLCELFLRCWCDLVFCWLCNKLPLGDNKDDLDLDLCVHLSVATADIWSLGVILFMLVCGQPPFQEANDSETLTMIMDCKYTVPAHVSNACEE